MRRRIRKVFRGVANAATFRHVPYSDRILASSRACTRLSGTWLPVVSAREVLRQASVWLLRYLAAIAAGGGFRGGRFGASPTSVAPVYSGLRVAIRYRPPRRHSSPRAPPRTGVNHTAALSARAQEVGIDFPSRLRHPGPRWHGGSSTRKPNKIGVRLWIDSSAALARSHLFHCVNPLLVRDNQPMSEPFFAFSENLWRSWLADTLRGRNCERPPLWLERVNQA